MKYDEMSLVEMRELQMKIEADLAGLRGAIGARKVMIAQEKYGVSVGDIVLAKDGSDYLVTNIDARWEGRPWLRGNKRKKNGQFGTGVFNLYDDWEKV